MRKIILVLLPLAVTVGIAAAVKAQAADQIFVPVSGLRNANGVVRCGPYAAAEAFPKAGQESRGAIAHIKGRQATCVAFTAAAFDYAGGAQTAPIRLTPTTATSTTSRNCNARRPVR